MQRLTLPPIDLLSPSRFVSTARPAGERAQAHVIALDGPAVLALLDFGYRGFAIETAESVRPRNRARFRCARQGARTLVAEAVCVHCHPLQTTPDRFLSWWEFPEQAELDRWWLE